MGLKQWIVVGMLVGWDEGKWSERGRIAVVSSLLCIMEGRTSVGWDGGVDSIGRQDSHWRT